MSLSLMNSPSANRSCSLMDSTLRRHLLTKDSCHKHERVRWQQTSWGTMMDVYTYMYNINLLYIYISVIRRQLSETTAHHHINFKQVLSLLEPLASHMFTTESRPPPMTSIHLSTISLGTTKEPSARGCMSLRSRFISALSPVDALLIITRWHSGVHCYAIRCIPCYSMHHHYAIFVQFHKLLLRHLARRSRWSHRGLWRRTFHCGRTNLMWTIQLCFQISRYVQNDGINSMLSFHLVPMVKFSCWFATPIKGPTK